MKANSSSPKSLCFPRSLAAPVEVIVHSLSDSIQQTFRDFRLGSSEWEDEVHSLFNDVDHFLAAEASPAATVAGSVAEEVAGLKGLVEQQTDVLTALVNALTGPSAAADLASEPAKETTAQPGFEVDPFERLQQAVAAASEAS